MFDYKINSELESILGAFSPEQMSVFLNTTTDVASGENYLTLFHEKFHHWQYLFTPYGHLKWGCYRSISSEVINIWLGATNSAPEERRVPISYLLENDDKRSLQGAVAIYLQEVVVKNINLMERYFIDSDIERILQFDKNEICPQIIVDGEEYVLNGIDIIESFAKYQEAILGYIMEKKKFEDIMDPSILRSEYYMAYIYFIEQLGNNRIMEFPAVCELALTVNQLCKFDNLHNWKLNHPAWRFIRIIECLKSNSDIIHLTPSNFKKKYVCYCNQLLEKCNYENLNTIWDSALEYANQADLSMAEEMIRAIHFKKKHEWILAYPFYSMDLSFQAELNSFQPYFYIFNNATVYSVTNNRMANEVLYENNFQAFAHQIRGNMSKCCLFKDELQCGFSYFGLNGCKYLDNGSCNGSINNLSKLDEIEINENGDIIKGCTFEIFLNIFGTSIRNIRIGDVSKKILFQELLECARKVKEV